jgi:hypothetical protein
VQSIPEAVTGQIREPAMPQYTADFRNGFTLIGIWEHYAAHGGIERPVREGQPLTASDGNSEPRLSACRGTVMIQLNAKHLSAVAFEFSHQAAHAASNIQDAHSGTNSLSQESPTDLVRLQPGPRCACIAALHQQIS